MAHGFRLAFFLCVILGVVISGAWSSQPAQRSPYQRCPYRWTRYGHRCFGVVASPRTMADAEHICIFLGGNLASVHNINEYRFMRALLHRVFRRSVRAWIGLFDAVQERRWMWTDGTPVRFTLWSRGEPDNRRNEDCTEMNWRGYYWNDIRCSNRRPFICSRRI